MPDKHEVWCVMGSGGAGKSTICDELEKSGGFVHVDRDTFMERYWNDLGGGFENFVRTLQSGERSKKREVLRSLRKKIEKLKKIFSENTERTGVPLTQYEEQYLATLKKLQYLSDDMLITYYTKDDKPLFTLMTALAEHETLSTALRKSRESYDHVLYNSPSLVGPFFEVAEGTFNHNGITPCLLVVRSTVNKILKAAGERLQAGLSDGLWKGRIAAALQSAQASVDGRGIEKVIICDNVGAVSDTVNGVRHRIMEGVYDSPVKWPVKLVL